MFLVFARMLLSKMTELKRSLILFLLLSNWNLILSEKRYGMFVNLEANEESNLICAQKCLAKEGCVYAVKGAEKGGCLFSNKPIAGALNGQVMKGGKEIFFKAQLNSSIKGYFLSIFHNNYSYGCILCLISWFIGDSKMVLRWPKIIRLILK